METLAYLVFYSCTFATCLSVIGALSWLIAEAQRGDDRARLMLFCVVLIAVIVGFGWSIEYLWGS